MEYTIVEITQMINQIINGHVVRLDGRIDGVYAAIFGSAAVVILVNIFLSKYNDWREDKRRKEQSLANGVGADDRFLQKSSPIGLNEFGKEKVEVLGIKAYIDSNIDEFLRKFNLDDEPVDIYETSKEISIAMFADEKMLKSKDMLAVRNKAYNEGIDLPAVVSMFSVYLRDKVLEKKALEQQSALSVNAP